MSHVDILETIPEKENRMCKFLEQGYAGNLRNSKKANEARVGRVGVDMIRAVIVERADQVRLNKLSLGYFGFL